MKAWQFVLSFIIASLILFFAVLSEYSYFVKIDNIEDPFVDEIVLDKVVEVAKGAETESILLTSGEFIRVFPESKIDFRQGVRDIISGEVFLSSHFISDKDRFLARSSIVLPFEIDSFKPRVAQYKVGPVIINNPTGSLFVKRNIDRGVSEIYSYDQDLEVYFNTSLEPFVIPPRHKITLRENNISDDFSKIFYSKQIKEFRLKPYTLAYLDFSEDIEPKTVAEKISVSIEKENRDLYLSFKNYARKVPNVWFKNNVNSSFGSFSLNFRALQSKISIGYPDSLKNKQTFQGLVKNFFSAYLHVSSNNNALAGDSLKEFAKIYNSTKWKQFFLSNPDYNNDWTKFERAQKAWLRTIFADSPEKPFIDFWYSLSTVRSIDLLEEHYSLIQHYRSIQQFDEVEQRILILNEAIGSLGLVEEDRIKVTKIRRLLGKMLFDTTLFHKDSFFDFYIKLVGVELDLYEKFDKDLHEITLENAYETLKFVELFLTEDYKQAKLNEELKKMFTYLDVSSLAKDRETEIFSESQMSLISMIESGQSLKDRDAFIEDERRNQNLEKILSTVSDDEEIFEDEEIYKEVFDKPSLIEYLNKLEIDTSQLSVRIIKGNLIRFSRGRYKSKQVSGTFDIEKQLFKIFTIDKYQQRNIALFIMESVMYQVSDMIAKENTGDEISDSVQSNFIDQKSVTSVIEREIIYKLFLKAGFDLSFKDVEKLDNQELNMFSLESVVLDNEYDLRFEYSYQDHEIYNLSVNQGRNSFQFSEDIPFDDLAEAVYDRMDELYAE